MIRRLVLAFAVTLANHISFYTRPGRGSIAFPGWIPRLVPASHDGRLEGNYAEGEVGIQNVYVNQRLELDCAGKFADGAIFVVDRFGYKDEGNATLKQEYAQSRLAVMLARRERFKQTWPGDSRRSRVAIRTHLWSRTGGMACFACHVPHVTTIFCSRGRVAHAKS
jgi:hypothetical protein